MRAIKLLGAAIGITSAALVFVILMSWMQMKFDEKESHGKENTTK